MFALQAEQFQVYGQDIPWLLEHWATCKPDHVALVWQPNDGDGQSWTYQALAEDARRLAAGLVARGIVLGDRVLIHMDNCPEMVLAWLACATVGAVGVTTNTASVAAELTYFVEKARCVAAITQPRYLSLVEQAARGVKWIATTDEINTDARGTGELAQGHATFSSLFGNASDWPGRAIEPMLPIGIMFTSGTTSKPKAVVYTHANAIWASRVGPRNIDLGTDDIYLIYLPFFHANAQSWSFYSVLGVGATAVLMPKWSPSRFWDVIARHNVTHTSLMPFTIATLRAPDRPATELRVGVFSLTMPRLDDTLGIGVYAAYGMTETITHSISAKPSDRLPPGSMGRVTAGYELAVVNKQRGELCGEGQTGELWLRGTRGVQLFLEYFDNPEANAKCFEGDWFKTGDIVRVGPGGSLYYQERDGDLLKVGGENVSAKEVEDVVVRVQGVAQVAVVGKTHDRLDEVVVAFVIRTPDAPDDHTLEQDILSACEANLSAFKVPRAVYHLTDFPRGALEKILKHRLRELADAQPPV